MPGLFAKAVKRLNDAVDYHAEILADQHAGRRGHLGAKKEAWYEHDEELRRRRHRHRHRHEEKREKAKDDGKRGERGGQGKEATAAGEGQAMAPEGKGENPSGASSEKGGHRHRRHGSRGHGHRRHRSPSGDRSGGRGGEGRTRHHHGNDNVGVEILERDKQPLGRELPPQEQNRRPGRRSEKWQYVDKKGRSVSPPKIELRPWVKKLFGGKPHPLQNSPKGAPQGNRGMTNGLRNTGNGRQQQHHRGLAPRHLYIDDAESAPGHPYVGSEDSVSRQPYAGDGPSSASTTTLAGSEYHAAVTEAKEVAEVEEDARAMKEGEVEDHPGGPKPPIHMPEPKDFVSERSQHPGGSEPPVHMPDPEDDASKLPNHPGPDLARHKHLNLDTDSEGEVSPLEEDDESDASTKATTASPKELPKGTPEDDLEDKPEDKPEEEEEEDKQEDRPKSKLKGKPKGKKLRVRGGAGGWSDADEYDLHEEYDDDYEEHGWNSGRDRSPKRNHQHTSQTYSSQGYAPRPPPRRAVDHSDSPFYRYGRQPVDHSDSPFYRPPPRRGFRVPPRGEHAFGFGSAPSPGHRGGSREPPRNSSSARHPSSGPRRPPRPSPYYDDMSELSELEEYYTSEPDSDSSYDEPESSSHRAYSGGTGGPQSHAPPPKPEDYYAILGISADSTEDEYVTNLIPNSTRVTLTPLTESKWQRRRCV